MNTLIDSIAKCFALGSLSVILYIQEYRSEQHSKLLKKHDAEISRLNKLFKDFKK